MSTDDIGDCSNKSLSPNTDVCKRYHRVQIDCVMTCILAGVGLEDWNSGRIFPRSCRVGSSDSEEYNTKRHSPGAAGLEGYLA